MSYRNYSTANSRIVSADGNGDFTTITAALAAASTGQTIFIRPGTYTENLTLKAGVNLTAFGSDGITGNNSSGNVVIIGKCTATFSGTCSLSGITLRTNADFCLVVSGSSDTFVNLINCFILAANNTAISYTTSGGGKIELWYCRGDCLTTGISIFSTSSTGALKFFSCIIENNGGSTTASTASAGGPNFYNSYFAYPITTSSTSSFVGADTSFLGTITIGGSGTNSISESNIIGGASTAVSIGTGATLTLSNSSINSSNTNAIDGAGTIIYAGLVFTGTSSKINTTTQTARNASEFHQVVVQTFTGNGTYTPTTGMKYCIIECLGGGGGGGGIAGGAATITSGGGGGAGSYSRKVSTAAAIGASQTVTIGGGGNGGTAGANNGSAGVDTSVGAICIGKGGSGGGGASSGNSGAGGLGGVAGTGDFIPTGQPGFTSLNSAAAGVFGLGGAGGSSLWGGGGRAPTGITASTAGNNATLYGSGGSGAGGQASATNAAGGNGSAGVVVITEYV